MLQYIFFMELLSPVGDLKSFYSAVYNGADAIYLGLKAFNARIKADNFTVDNKKTVIYGKCEKCGVKNNA